MVDTLTQEQKDNMQTAYLHKQEEQHQVELVQMKSKRNKTTKEKLDILNKELGRPVCNKCTAVIRLYEMPKFFRNGGHCESCSKNA